VKSGNRRKLFRSITLSKGWAFTLAGISWFNYKLIVFLHFPIKVVWQLNEICTGLLFSIKVHNCLYKVLIKSLNNRARVNDNDIIKWRNIVDENALETHLSDIWFISSAFSFLPQIPAPKNIYIFSTMSGILSYVHRYLDFEGIFKSR